MSRARVWTAFCWPTPMRSPTPLAGMKVSEAAKLRRAEMTCPERLSLNSKSMRSVTICSWVSPVKGARLSVPRSALVSVPERVASAVPVETTVHLVVRWISLMMASVSCASSPASKVLLLKTGTATVRIDSS